MTMRSEPLKDIIFLLGAGASKNADIKTSAEMIQLLEDGLSSNVEHAFLYEVFRFVKGAIHFAQGCQEQPKNIVMNIEDIMKTLRLLDNRQNEELYPFVGSWHEKISQFENKRAHCFKNLIDHVELKLLEWISIEGKELKANYLQGFSRLAKNTGSQVRIFTLNYDLTIEKSLENLRDCDLQLGFDSENKWNSYCYEDGRADIYLYKLHGSIDWYRDEDGIINKSINKVDKPFIIFGVDNKMQSIDPFFYLTYQFREYALRASIIVIIGYSFGDSYINRIIFQAVQSDPRKTLLVVNKSTRDLKSRLCNTCFNEMEYELSDSKVYTIETETEKLFLDNLLEPMLERIHSEMQEDMPF
ncbi:MAG: SIR2 family protein [Syntrophobacteraceae bacterium]